jgi:hypothetical protein
MAPQKGRRVMPGTNYIVCLERKERKNMHENRDYRDSQIEVLCFFSFFLFFCKSSALLSDMDHAAGEHQVLAFHIQAGGT